MTGLSAASLGLAHLRRIYQQGQASPSEIVAAVYERIAEYADPATWTYLVPREEALRRARELEARRDEFERLPLYGIPFGVKDNIDAAGVPTSVGCPAYAFVPQRSAPSVKNSLDAGAILIGKNNLDQFATGLVGARSPYGTPRNPFNASYIPGGSSSGSAVAVAAGMASFSIGTDTAGSGRVPASFNNIVGFKPTRGLLSLEGVAPACRTLDCTTILALSCEDAVTAAQGAGGNFAGALEFPAAGFRLGVPRGDELQTFGDIEAKALFAQAVERTQKLGGEIVEIDYSPFREAGALLYGGPWVVERLTVFADFLRQHPEQVLPVTRSILEGARRFTAVDVFSAYYKLEEMARRAAREWKNMDALLVPTAPAIYKVEEVLANPIELNSNLGYYTTFANLMGCCALAVPSGFRANGLPFGVSFIAPNGQDGMVCALGAAYQRSVGGTLGATTAKISEVPALAAPHFSSDQQTIRVAVVGAHLSGMPLNYQLAESGAHLVRACATKAAYRLYELPGVKPRKPGLLRCSEGGHAMAVEVWEMPVTEFGRFAALAPAPLVFGTVELFDGEQVKGFLCESHAVEKARDISSFGGWRRYLDSLRG